MNKDNHVLIKNIKQLHSRQAVSQFDVDNSMLYNSNNIMLQERTIFQSPEDTNTLTHELHQYRKINTNLRRKIKEKDIKIQQLFGFIEDAGKQLTFTPQPSASKNYSLKERSLKLNLSDNAKKEKENKHFQSIQQGNFFKQPSYSVMNSNHREELRLPTLDKKVKAVSIFQHQDFILDNPQKRKRVVRIPLQKLKPLDSEEVKKRFLLKYQKSELIGE